MILKPRRKRRSSAPVFIIWLTLTLALGMMGVAVAAWQDGIGVSGIVSTGDIDPVFTWVSDGASIRNGGKTISISIEDAYPGQSFCFGYTITNRGSIPVSLYNVHVDADYGLEVDSRLFRDFIGGDGDEADGELYIQVGEVEEDLEESDTTHFFETYRFDLNLTFRQWNIP
ncbi:MAG: hypothetical protein ACOYEO_02620 [bacterium]